MLIDISLYITFKYEKFVICDLNHVMKLLICNQLRDQALILRNNILLSIYYKNRVLISIKKFECLSVL